MSPWMLQGLAAGCLLTAALAVVQKERSKSSPTGTGSEEKSHFRRAGTPLPESLPDRLPSKTRGLRREESYASRMRTLSADRIEEGEIVTVGGQVHSPGPIPLTPSATLQSVVAKAGGATPFGALRRVRLTRGVNCTEHDLTTPEGRSIRVQRKDTVDVPQKMLLGY